LNNDELLFTLKENMILLIFSYYKYLCSLEKESKELEEQEKNNKKQEEIIKSILSKK
jgi:hypothetical protein